MKYKMKKGLFVFLAMFVILTSFNLNVKANVTNITPTGYTHTGTAVNPNNPLITAIFNGQSIDRITTDTGIGVCIEPWKLVENWTGYTVTQLDNIQLSNIWYYAYANTAQTNWDYAVGQLMVWEYFGYVPTSHTVPNYATRKSEVNQAIAKMYTKPSFNGQTVTINAGESITLTDKNGVLADFKGVKTSSPGINVTQNGNQLTINASIAADENSTFSWNKIPSSLVGQSFVHMHSNSQAIATPMRNDPLPFKINIRVNKFGSVDITKYDNEANKIPGTQFTLSYNADMSNPVGTYTTGADGSVQIDNLNAGERIYYQEVSVPNPLVLDNTIRSIVIEPNVVAPVDVTNLIQKATATLKKVDAEIGSTPQGDATLLGAKYELRAKNDIINPITKKVFYKAGAVVATRVTRVDGTTDPVTNLYNGLYEWVEVSASNGYLVNPQRIEVDLSYQGSNVTTFTKNFVGEETVIKGKVQILKISTDGTQGVVSPLTGAEFTAKLESEVNRVGWDNAKTYAVITSDFAGLATTPDLAFGKYLFKETKTPDGKITSPDFSITVNENNKTYSIVVNNAPFKSYVKIVKQDLDGNNVVISNASFQIKDDKGEIVKQKVGDKYVDTFTTDERGYIVTPQMLGAGKYTIDEVKIPNGFLELEKPLEFEITNRYDFDVDADNQPIVTVIAKNEKPTARIELTKTFEDEKDNGLGGATFKLTANSKIVDPATGDIIYNVGDAVNVDTAENGLYTIDETGHLLIDGLPMSTGNASYKLQEVSTLNGYVLDEKEYVINFTQENTSQKLYIHELALENKQTTIEVLKSDVKGKSVVGAEIQVLDEKGNVVDEWTTTKDTHIIKGLHIDKTYTLREWTTPKHYVQAKDITFTVENTKEVQEVTMIDKQMSVAKVDSITNEFVEGARLQITNNKTKQIVDEWVTTDEVYYPSNLIEGMEYTLTELEAPNGFKIAEPIIFTVSDDKELQEIVMKDEPILSSIQVNKVDSTTNKTIKSKNFEFTIYSDELCESKINTVSADVQSGTATFEDLRFGEYWIKETKAPLGFLLSNEVKHIEINKDGVYVNGELVEEKEGVHSFVYFNSPLRSVKTGDDSSTAFYLLTIMISAGVILVVRNKKRQ